MKERRHVLHEYHASRVFRIIRACDSLYNKVYYFFSNLACSMYLSMSIA